MTDRQSEIRATLESGGRKRHWGRVVVVLVLLAAVAGAAVWYVTGPGAGTELGYRTGEVTRGDLTVTVTATGSIEPRNVVEISSELSGTLTAVNVGFNDEVTAGEVLAGLDTTQLEAQLEVSRASHAASDAAVASAKATLDEATANAALAQNLYDRGTGSHTTLDAAVAARARAEAAHQQAIANRDLALANYQAQQAELEKACICSPIDGVVLDVAAETGQIVASSLSAPTLFTIAEDLRQMELQVDVAEADIGLIAVGNSANFTVEAYDERSFPAEISQVRYASEVTDGLVTYKAILAVDNPDLALRPGMTAVAEIEVAHVNDTLLVPNAALRYAPPAAADPEDDEGGSGGFLGMMMPDPPGMGTARGEADPGTIWLMRAGTPVEVAVETGRTDGSLTAILSGDIAEGDQVILARTRSN